MTGTQILRASAPKRALPPESAQGPPTAYADTEAAIRAINEVGLDHYLLKPWDPPELQALPRARRPPRRLARDRGGPRTTGSGARGRPGTAGRSPRRVKREFLSRNGVPYRWLDVEADPTARELPGAEVAGEDAEPLPLVVFPYGTRWSPTAPLSSLTAWACQHPGQPAHLRPRDRRRRAGRVWRPPSTGPPRGWAPCSSSGRRPADRLGTSSRIENYLGFPVGPHRGRPVAPCVGSGATVRCGDPLPSGPGRRHPPGTDPYSGSWTLADGEVRRPIPPPRHGVASELHVPASTTLTGSGVFYGAAHTEATSAARQAVFVVGAANSAGQGPSSSPARPPHHGALTGPVSRRACRTTSSTGAGRRGTTRSPSCTGRA